MVKIKLITIGKVKEKYLVDAVKEYQKRLQGYCKLELIELKEESVDSPKATVVETERVLGAIASADYKIALAINGKDYTSEDLAAKLEHLMVDGKSTVAFIIGSSHGLSEEVYNNVDLKLSFSKMTFPHQLFKVMLIEQIYRAFKIMKNESYHK